MISRAMGSMDLFAFGVETGDPVQATRVKAGDPQGLAKRSQSLGTWGVRVE